MHDLFGGGFEQEKKSGCIDKVNKNAVLQNLLTKEPVIKPGSDASHAMQDIRRLHSRMPASEQNIQLFNYLYLFGKSGSENW